MSIIYRKTFKGIDEVAFNAAGLPARLVNYLSAVDGTTPVDQLAEANRHLASLAVVLDGLREQGFLEVADAGGARNVVKLSEVRVGNGAPMPQQQAPSSASPQVPLSQFQAPQFQTTPAQQQPQPQQQQPYYQPPPSAPPYQQPQQPQFGGELEILKGNMMRDVSQVLGADAPMVITKIQNCRSRDDLFAAMMGIKKIIGMYADKSAAEKFAMKYQSLAG